MSAGSGDNRLDAFWLEFRELLSTHRMEGAVLVLDDGTGRSVTMGWPGCPEDCQTREMCMAATLEAAARHLEKAADKLEQGTAQVVLDAASTTSAKRLMN